MVYNFVYLFLIYLQKLLILFLFIYLAKYYFFGKIYGASILVPSISLTFLEKWTSKSLKHAELACQLEQGKQRAYAGALYHSSIFFH
jgi:hypothetical protein